MTIQQIVADPEWQALRSSLVGTWKYTPERSVLRLRIYAGDFSDPLRLRRLHNYLTGTAFRLGKISHPEITALLTQIRTARGKV